MNIFERLDSILASELETSNFKYELNGELFTWDTIKAGKNKRKHQIEFELGAETFFDKYALEGLNKHKLY